MAQTSSAALEASIVPTPLLSFNLNKLLIFVQQKRGSSGLGAFAPNCFTGACILTGLSQSGESPVYVRLSLISRHGVLSVLRVSVVNWFWHFYHHGGTENTENALRQSQIRTRPNISIATPSENN